MKTPAGASKVFKDVRGKAVFLFAGCCLLAFRRRRIPESPQGVADVKEKGFFQDLKACGETRTRSEHGQLCARYQSPAVAMQWMFAKGGRPRSGR
jgi:hypothetical protein